ncbi:MAG: hypothetical protein FJ009_00700 [Chloroflexi bacterium]|nr:hypothetical protein [Chloroflexota bacterium]
MFRVSFQAVAILIFAATLFFLWDFSQRVITNVRLAQTEKVYEQGVATEEARNKALREQKQRVQTDAYADWYARHHWRWALPGDTVVVPQKTPAPTPNVSAPAPTPPPAKAWWQDLLDFLFGP